MLHDPALIVVSRCNRIPGSRNTELLNKAFALTVAERAESSGILPESVAVAGHGVGPNNATAHAVFDDLAVQPFGAIGQMAIAISEPSGKWVLQMS